MDFIPTLAMSLEMILFEYVFCKDFRRRNYHFVKLIGAGLIVLTLVFWIEVFYFLKTGSNFGYGESTSEFSGSVFRFLYYLTIYIMTIIVMFFCFRESAPQILLACCGGYAIQHISFNLCSLFGLIPFSNSTVSLILSVLFRIALDIFFVFNLRHIIRRHQTQGLYQGNQVRKLILSFVDILLCIGLSRLAIDDPSRGVLATIAESLYAVVSCSLILALIFGLNESDEVHTEVDAMKEMLHQEREQYSLSKQNIELINIKCHDLKHQIAALRTDASEKNISDIEHAIMIYDTSIKTGNDVLDVILREKALQCEAEHITLTCMVQGELIAFMDTMDVYSLFGNILSNAIEAVRQISDPDKRIITLNARKISGMLSLHCENYYTSEIKMADDLPQTTKEDVNNHGFGMKSMKRTAEKYQGVMTIETSDNRFCLDFLFPISD